MPYTIAKEWTFSAAHHLPQLPAGHKCQRPHGHNYRVQLVLSAPALDRHGFIIDYAVMQARFGDWLHTTLDHRDLNDVLEVPSTAEHLAKWLHDAAKLMFVTNGLRVRVAESDSTWAEYGE